MNMQDVLQQRSRWIACVLLVLGTMANGANFQVTYADGAGEGFNDATLGAARKTAFEYAMNLWAGMLSSSETIRVEATFDPLGGSPFGAVLGQAGANQIFANFSGAPLANTWYPDALADSLRGADNNPGSPDIYAFFNSDVDNAYVLGATDWYYGTDGNSGSHIDFVSVVLHELCHGLGFFDLVNETNGSWFLSVPDIYGRHLERPSGSPSAFLSMTNGQRLSALTSEDVRFAGSAANAANGGTNPPIYAPSPYQNGSSISHFDTSMTPDQLMEPSYTGANHSPGLALAVFQDMGWALATPTNTPTPTHTVTPTATPAPLSIVPHAVTLYR